MKYYNFSKNEINFLKNIFFNSANINNVEMIISSNFKKKNLKIIESIYKIEFNWSEIYLSSNNIKNYLILSFKENSQFKFDANFKYLEQEFIYSSENDIKSNSESEYNLKCLNYFEECLRNIGLEFNTVDLMSFIFKQKITPNNY